MSRLPLFPGKPRPLLFAHRGVSAVAPENTMAAFRLAKELGVPGVELDIHLCASGELVVIHDDDTARTTGTASRVEASRLSELKMLDAGSWKAARYAGERIPLLAELFEELGDALYFDVEIKCRTPSDTGIERALARLIADMRMGERVAVSSFNPFSLARFKAIEPRVPTAIIYCESEELPGFLRRGAGRWIGRTDYLKPERAQARPRPRGRAVVPWTVDDPALASRLVASGCDGVISNRPHELGIA